MTSFILPLNITITIDETHNIYDLIQHLYDFGKYCHGDKTFS